jgi:hypothetical protein
VPSEGPVPAQFHTLKLKINEKGVQDTNCLPYSEFA